MAGSFGDELATLLGQISIQEEANAQTADQLTELAVAGKQLNDSIALRSQAAVKDNTTVVRAQEEALLKAQQNTTRAATAFGSNMNDPAEIITRLGTEMNQRYQRSTELAADIADKKSMNFFSDPIGYLRMAIELPSQIGEYNKEAQLYNMAESHLISMNNLTQEIAKTQATITPVRTQATVEATVNLEAAKAKNAADAIRLNGVKWNRDAIREVTAMNIQQLQLKKSAYELQATQENRAFQREQLQLQRELRLEALEAKRLDQEAQQQMVLDVKTGLGVLGFTDVNNLAPSKVINYLKLKDPIYAEALSIGMTKNATGRSEISQNPAIAAEILIRTKAPEDPNTSATHTALKEAYGAASEGRSLNPIVPPPQGFDAKDRAQVLALANANALWKAQSDLKTIKPNDYSNIYLAPAGTSIAALPAVQSDPFFAKVLAPQIATGFNDSNPDRVLSLAVSSISKGEVTFEQAAQGITLYYNAAIKLNDSLKNYSGVGLPNQEVTMDGGGGYNALVKSQFRGTEIVDMSDRIAVNKALSLRLMAMQNVEAQKKIQQRDAVITIGPG